MIGGRNVRWLPEGDETKLCATDVVEVFPPTAGG
jgi:molybdopterin converting factor small subunit